MKTRLQRSLVLLGVVLSAMVAVASGTGVPGARSTSGYARLLEPRASIPTYQDSPVADCVMEGARLRLASGNGEGMAERPFEDLRAFCRKAARMEAQAGRMTPAPDPVMDHETDHRPLRPQPPAHSRLDSRDLARQGALAADKTRHPGPARSESPAARSTLGTESASLYR